MSILTARLRALYQNLSLLTEEARVKEFADLAPLLVEADVPIDARILWLLLQTRDKIESPQRVLALDTLEEAERLAISSNNLEWTSELYRLRAFLLQSRGDSEHAFQLLVKAYTDAQAVENYWSLSIISLNLGVLSANSGDYDGASVYLNRCLELAERVEVDQALQAQAHLVLAQAQLERGALNEALHHASKSYTEYRKLGNNARAASSASLLASVKIELKDIPAAKEVLSEIDFDQTNPVHRVSLLNLRAKLGSLDRRFPEALRDHDTAIALASEIGIHRLATNSIQLKCETLLLQERASETLALLSEIGDEQTKGYDLLTMHELRSKAFEQLERFKEAFDEQKKFAVLQKDLLSERASNALSRLRAAQEVLQAEREAAHFRERSQFYAKELSQRTSYLVQQNEYVNNVIDHLQSLASQRPDASEILKDIRKRLRQLPAASFDWNEYLRLFDEIHPNALAILEERYPDLSKTESKICSLVLAKLSNIDISRLLVVSERTVENHRYRLRKKLGLSVDVDLTAFLEQILSDRAKHSTQPQNTYAK